MNLVSRLAKELPMRKIRVAAIGFGLVAVFANGEAPNVDLSGQAWIDYGRVMNFSDSLTPGGRPNVMLDLNGNTQVSPGGQFTLAADLAEQWEAAFGFGAHRVSHSTGRGTKAFLAISMYHLFITESRLTWFKGEKIEPTFSITLGTFPFKYNRDVQNLGLYLFRGPVYPGLLMGGFGDFATDTTKGTQLGLKISHKFGAFSHDLILNTERELPPTFDWSLGYVAKYAIGPLELGTGVNFYRVLPYKEKLMVPGKLPADDLRGVPRSKYIEVDSANPTDTVFFTHQGTKVMGMAALDVGAIMGMPEVGFRLYTEGALLGITNYGKTYGDRSKRIPIMFGISIPTFGFLDKLSFEMEWYGSPYRNDLSRIGNTNNVADWTQIEKPIPSPKPVDNSDYAIDENGIWMNAQSDSVYLKGTALDKENVTSDDFKWSLNLEKSLLSRIKITAQAANDHYRPRPASTNLIAANGGTAEAFNELSNWYFMLRMGYFF